LKYLTYKHKFGTLYAVVDEDREKIRFYDFTVDADKPTAQAFIEEKLTEHRHWIPIREFRLTGKRAFLQYLKRQLTSTALAVF